MIYGRNFNIVHMPKTGGTWARRVCEQLPRRVINHIYPRHRSYWELQPPEYCYPTYIFVRNPWDWYVSIYHHKHTNIEKRRYEFATPVSQLDIVHKIQHQQFHSSFEHSVRFIENWNRNSEHRAIALRWVSEIFDDFTQKPVPTAKDVIVLRYEDGVREGLKKILLDTGNMTDEIARLIDTHPPQNVSQGRKNYQSYYSPELREVVAKRNRNLITKYGYEFDGSKKES